MKMLEKIYENLSEKKLKQALTINYGILITSIAFTCIVFNYWLFYKWKNLL